MTALIALLIVLVTLLALHSIRLQRRVAKLEKGRVALARQLDFLSWRLDGEPGSAPGPDATPLGCRSIH